jgi:hypothetical protein
MFSGLKVIATAVTKGKKAKKQVSVDGMEFYAQLDAAVKAIGALQGAVKSELQQTVLAEFMAEIQQGGGKPESFEAIEGTATASVQLRKRGTNSPLSEGEREILEAANIPVHEEIIVPELYAINQEFAADTELMLKVEAALTGVVPEGFFALQAKKSKFVVSDDTLKAAFRTVPSEEVVNIVTTLAFRPALSTVDLPTILDDIKDMIVANASVAQAAGALDAIKATADAVAA